MSSEKLTKFQKYFCDYGEYHSNKTNILIHLVFVPILTFGYYGFFQIIPSALFLKGTIYEVNLSFINYFFFGLIYFYIDPFCGLLTNIWLTFSCLYSRVIYLEWLQKDCFWSYFVLMLIVNVIGWGVQIIGHNKFEGRKPAVTDNPILMFSAPFFVTAEILKFIGWKKKEFLIIDKEIERRIKDFNNKKN